MKYAVLGSDSFSGKHFCRYLQENGCEVLPIGRSTDINSCGEHIVSILKFWKPHYVVNFIAKGLVNESWGAPDQWLMTNTLSMTRLIEKLRHMPIVRYVHVSTPEVYGSGTHSERSPYNPSTPYAVSKAATEMMLFAYYKAYQFPCVITRSANVYGSGQEKRVIPIAMKCKHEGTVFNMHGLGSSLRSFIHINDVCSATKLLAETGRNGEAYNISTKSVISIRELVERIGCKYQSVPERLNKDHSYVLESDKIRALGWSDKITLLEGLEQLWAEKLTSSNSHPSNEAA